MRWTTYDCVHFTGVRVLYLHKELVGCIIWIDLHFSILEIGGSGECDIDIGRSEFGRLRKMLEGKR